MKKTAKESNEQTERMNELAKAYLDMVEKQMTSTLTHPQFVESMLTGMANMQAFSVKTSEKAKPDVAPARHTAPAPKSESNALLRLERRVAFLERQLHELRAALLALRPDVKPTARAKPVSAKPSASVGVANGARSKSGASRAKVSPKGKTAPKKPAAKPRKR